MDFSRAIMGETKNIELTGIVQTFFSCMFFLVLSKFDANYPLDEAMYVLGLLDQLLVAINEYT